MHYNQALVDEIELRKSLAKEKTLLNSILRPAGELAKQALAQKTGGHQFGQWQRFILDPTTEFRFNGVAVRAIEPRSVLKW